MKKEINVVSPEEDERVHMVLTELTKGTSRDELAICQRFGFTDMSELGQYMKSKGYKWNTKLNNYEKDAQMITSIEETDGAMEHSSPSVENHHVQEPSLELYLPLLEMLKHNEKRLTELLIPYGKGNSIPRYTIEGIAKTKTVQMIHTLSNMVTEFAEEKNISQRDLFEVALIDFFRKYGYEKEVAQTLKIH
ncbi:hypothetical protein CSV69_10185 [Sporosarcina sp. P26b]|uniref:hypothetical protein n=1 Tax=Sporosarcina sp. P26b TaxID=2048253 RepID=UPI000C171A26|nr:hypothetical protein [Sporosarcina sp. P26b]PIC95699.1 hypothetical protein CSV69_10185 [Sporosarcina sp. P26b]